MYRKTLFILALIIFVVAEDDHDHDHDHDHDGPCYEKEDHNDDHTDYYETIRLHTLTAGTTIAEATTAIDNYLSYVAERDDVIEFFGFYDASSSTYLTSGTWRTRQGAIDSFNYGTSKAPYSDKLTLTQSYNGNITNFLEVLEIHSASERNYFKGVRIGNLVQPSVWNNTNIPPIIKNGLFPILEPMNGFIDYSTSYPETPVANTYWVTQSTWEDETSSTNGLTSITDWLNQNLADKVQTQTVYQGVVVNFYHSEPNTCSASVNIILTSLVALLVLFV